MSVRRRSRDEASHSTARLHPSQSRRAASGGRRGRGVPIRRRTLQGNSGGSTAKVPRLTKTRHIPRAQGRLDSRSQPDVHATLPLPTTGTSGGAGHALAGIRWALEPPAAGPGVCSLAFRRGRSYRAVCADTSLFDTGRQVERRKSTDAPSHLRLDLCDATHWASEVTVSLTDTSRRSRRSRAGRSRAVPAVREYRVRGRLPGRGPRQGGWLRTRPRKLREWPWAEQPAGHGGFALSHACRTTVPETGHTPGPGTLRLGGGAGADPCGSLP
jgi:hypothetical protein